LNLNNKVFIKKQLFLNLMDKIFEIVDKSKRRVYLSKEKWQHILSKHSRMSGTQILEDIKDALINPALIVRHKYDGSKRNYY